MKKYFHKFVETPQEVLATLINASFVVMALSLWVILESLVEWSENGRISFAGIAAVFFIINYAGVLYAAYRVRKNNRNDMTSGKKVSAKK